jgi:hypothetical protein
MSSKRTYPRIGESGLLPVAPRCDVCGAVATNWVFVQVSYMRGDDVHKHACAEHRKDAAALLGIATTSGDRQ